jgi:putative membrane protein
MGVLAGISQLVLADPGGWDHMDGWDHMGGWGWAAFGWVFMVLIVVLVVWLIWSTTSGVRQRPTRRPSALDVLDERYARGEIDRDEYQQRKDDLEA